MQRKLLFLPLLLLGCLPLRGQYLGGTDDGHDLTVTIVQLATFNQTGIYSGGADDGHDLASATVQLLTFNQAGIYSGGADDGHDLASATVQLLTFDQAGIYSGGADDGHDLATATVQLLTFDQAGIYGGGADDGHDLTSATVQLATFEQFAIYGGGSDDGHDMITATNAVVLPLTLISFSAEARATYVLLTWTTADERDTDYFTVERTTDGSTFAAVGTAPAAGFSEPGEELRYELTDTAPRTGVSYYRLRTTDLDGSFQFSSLEEVRYDQPVADWDYRVFPNPNSGRRLHLQTSGQPGARLDVLLTDANGRRVAIRSFTVGGGEIGAATHTIDLGRRLPAGSYLLRVTTDRSEARSKVIVVQ